MEYEPIRIRSKPMKHIILTVSMLITLSRAQSPWVPPIGIPAPGFGIAEQAPAQPAAWPAAEAAGNYYIDNTNSNATDAANAYGYPAKPRMTIPQNLVVAANSLVEIHGGPYFTTLTSYAWTIDSSTTNPPTSLAPAFIKGFGNVLIAPSQAAIDAGAASRIEIGKSDIRYTVIDGIHFKVILGIAGLTGHHLCIRNCESSDCNGEAINLTTWEAGSIHDVVFYNNQIHDTAFWNDTTKDWDYHGIDVNTFGRTSATSLYNVWVVDNTFYHVSGDSVQVNANTAGNAALHHVYIGRNTAYENRQSGFWCKQASHVIMSQNTVHTMDVIGAGLTGTGLGFQYGPDNLWIIFNEVYGCDFGIRQSDTVSAGGCNVYIIGNYIHDTTQNIIDSHWGSPEGWGISFWSGSENRYVVDNTLVNVFGGIETIAAGPVYGNGNLIYNLKPNTHPEIFGPYCSHISCSNSGGDGVNVDYVNCLFYGQVGAASQQARINWLGVPYANLASAQSAVGKFANCVEANPLLAGVALQANSPAIDAGLQAGVYQTFQNLYGIDIRKGFDGVARPIGAGWDIGACEYPGVSSPKLPPPGNPKVDFPK